MPTDSVASFGNLQVVNVDEGKLAYGSDHLPLSSAYDMQQTFFAYDPLGYGGNFVITIEVDSCAVKIAEFQYLRDENTEAEVRKVINFKQQSTIENTGSSAQNETDSIKIIGLYDRPNDFVLFSKPYLGGP